MEHHLPRYDAEEGVCVRGSGRTHIATLHLHIHGIDTDLHPPHSPRNFFPLHPVGSLRALRAHRDTAREREAKLEVGLPTKVLSSHLENLVNITRTSVD